MSLGQALTAMERDVTEKRQQEAENRILQQQKALEEEKRMNQRLLDELKERDMEKNILEATLEQQ